ncbi:MAG: CHRD domain-containing protein [Chitinophagaceae bacterium]|nr:CHRD domain-containing protein [Chitinophagaceae bacterium]
MKIAGKLASIAAVFLLSAAFASCKKETANANEQSYKANCNGASQAPPNSSTATATFVGKYNSNSGTFSGTLTYSGITPTGWYIQKGTTMANAEVIASLGAVVTSPVSVSVQLNASAAAELKAGNCYINIQSAAYPSGEIRGKLVLQ